MTKDLITETRPKSPLVLPRFIFIAGGTEEEINQIVGEICEETLSSLPCEFFLPLRAATVDIFFNGLWEKVQDDQDPLPFLREKRPLVAFMEELRSTLQSRWGGSDVLGKIALSGIDQDIADTFIFTDTPSAHEVRPFYEAHGPDECMVLLRGDANLESWWQSLPKSRIITWKTVPALMEVLKAIPSPTRIWKQNAHEEGSAA